MRLLALSVLLFCAVGGDFRGSSPEGRWTLDSGATWDRFAPSLPEGLGEITRAASRTLLDKLGWDLDLNSDGTMTGSVLSDRDSGTAPMRLAGTWKQEGDEVLMMLSEPADSPRVLRAQLKDGVMSFEFVLAEGQSAREFVFRRQS